MNDSGTRIGWTPHGHSREFRIRKVQSGKLRLVYFPRDPLLALGGSGKEMGNGRDSVLSDQSIIKERKQESLGKQTSSILS